MEHSVGNVIRDLRRRLGMTQEDFSRASLLLKHGLINQTEIETGRPAPGAPKLSPPFTAGEVARTLGKGAPTRRDVPAPAVLNT